MSDYGIDYGMGSANIDKETRIRFGVINQNAVLQSWADSAEGYYGPPTCGECGNEAIPIEQVPFDLDDWEWIGRGGVRPEGHSILRSILRIPTDYREECGGAKEWNDEGGEFACLECARSFDSEDAYSDEPLGFNFDDGEYQAHQNGDDSDIFITQSPYYTHAQFCSPCAPGACSLECPVDKNGPKAYCFAPEWFDYGRVTGEYLGVATTCPYPVYRVSDGVCIYRPYGVKDKTP